MLYGVQPVLLETFVDPNYYQGTCYRGANWQCIGKTKGRGRQGTGDLTKPKDIYCLPLYPDFRKFIGGKEPCYDQLFLVAEKDVWDDYHLGLRLVFRYF